MDRGERRPEVGTLGDIVDAHDREVLRNAPPQPMRSVQDTERHLVVAGKDRVDVGRAVQHNWYRPSSPLAAVQSPSTTRSSSDSAGVDSMVCRQPASRCRASHQSSGPVTTPIFLAPPARRCSVAIRPMARLSMPMDGRSCSPAVPPTRTSGTGTSWARERSQARLLATSGMAHRTPSTWRPTRFASRSSTSSVSGRWMSVSEIE